MGAKTKAIVRIFTYLIGAFFSILLGALIWAFNGTFTTWISWYLLPVSLWFIAIRKFFSKCPGLLKLLVYVAIYTASFYRGILYENGVSAKAVALRNITILSAILSGGADEIIFKMKDNFINEAPWKVPEGYSLSKKNANGVPLEILTKLQENVNVGKEAVLLFHGGGFCVGLGNIFRDFAVRLSQSTYDNRPVIMFDYHTAPEFVYPAAHDDAIEVWNYITTELGYDANNISVIGDSAGAGLAASTILRLRDNNRKLPKVMILISPWVDLANKGETWITNKYKDPTFGLHLGMPDVEKKLFKLYRGDVDPTDKYLSPVYHNFRGMPKMLIQVGSREVLLDDSITLFEKAESDGVDARLHVFNGLFHDFQLIEFAFPEGTSAWTEISEYLNS